MEEADRFAPEMADQLREMGSEAAELLPTHFRWTGAIEPAVLRRKLEDLKRLPQVEVVESTESQRQASVEAYQSLLSVLRLLGFGLATALGVGFFHLARTNAAALADVKRLLLYWGASRFAQRLPSALSVAMNGIVAGVFAGLGWWMVVPRLARMAERYVPALASAASGQSHSWTRVFFSGLTFPAICLMTGLGLGLISACAVWFGLGERETS